MATRATRRSVLTGLAAGALIVSGGRSAWAAETTPAGPDPEPPVGCGQPEDLGAEAALDAVAYAVFRVVREVPGDPEVPEITLPAGYGFVPGSQYQVASRGEYYSYLSGPRADAGVPVSVRWPGQHIAAVIAGDARLELVRDPADPYRVTFLVPVVRASASADQPTLQMFSYLSAAESGVAWRVEHNEPDRAAGYWAGVDWPAGEVRAVVNYMVATEAVLRDSGLAAQAQARGHCFYLMGFETNNLLHVDNPPHWHMCYYPGLTTSATPATVPHYWVDSDGWTFYNGQDVTGQARGKYHAGEPAPIYDGSGTLVVTTTIRADGGLDITPPTGPGYAILAGDGDYPRGVEVWRDGRAWRTVASCDDVRAGRLRTEVRGCGHHPPSTRVEYRYDPLTGVLRSRSEHC